jgi:chorismate mutase
MPVRGIRGATTATCNEAEAIIEATTELLEELTRRNRLDLEEIAFAYFTTTTDLNAEFPAFAARRLGWVDVPMLCGHDMEVLQPNPRGIPLCIRMLLLYNTEKKQKEMAHVYMRGAQAIKSDLERTRTEVEGIVGTSSDVGGIIR